jgi:NAD(P)-dependent dehydrogenase (short-subunit alcohol dehydrogenase family)
VACSGTGYIGSFTALALLEQGYDVVIIDNLYNSSAVAVDRIELLCGKRPAFYKVDVTDEAALEDVFSKHPTIDSVIHFAALKASLFRNRIPSPSTGSDRAEEQRLTARSIGYRPLENQQRFPSNTTVSMSVALSHYSGP